jgi:DNA mismatch endonuclease, patch repair protein
MDTVTRERRSEIMSRIRSKGTAPERAVARALRGAGARGWRRHRRVLGTTPDFSWARERVALFVDGCFWHGCPRHYRAPRSNRRFWRRKLETNTRRDDLHTRWLRTCGWLVVHAFECDVRRPADALLLATVIRKGVLVPREPASAVELPRADPNPSEHREG